MALVRSVECVLPPRATDDALGCVCLRWTAAESRVSESDVDRLKRERTIVPLQDNGLV